MQRKRNREEGETIDPQPLRRLKIDPFSLPRQASAFKPIAEPFREIVSPRPCSPAVITSAKDCYPFQEAPNVQEGPFHVFQLIRGKDVVAHVAETDRISLRDFERLVRRMHDVSTKNKWLTRYGACVYTFICHRDKAVKNAVFTADPADERKDLSDLVHNSRETNKAVAEMLRAAKNTRVKMMLFHKNGEDRFDSEFETTLLSDVAEKLASVLAESV